MTQAPRAARAPRRRTRSPGAARRPGRRPPDAPRGSAGRRSRPSARLARARPDRRTIGARVPSTVTTGLSQCGAAAVAGARASWVLDAGSAALLELRWRGARREPLCLGCRRLLRRLGPDPVVLSGVAGLGADGIRRPGPRPGPRAEVPWRDRRGRHDGRTDRRERDQPDAGRSARAGAPASAPTAAARLQPGRTDCGSAIARRTGLELADCLARAGSSATQVGRDRRERSLGPAGQCRAALHRARARALVDDVATTGATLAACAAVLRDGGAIEVAAVVFARTIGR